MEQREQRLPGRAHPMVEVDVLASGQQMSAQGHQPRVVVSVGSFDQQTRKASDFLSFQKHRDEACDVLLSEDESAVLKAPERGHPRQRGQGVVQSDVQTSGCFHPLTDTGQPVRGFHGIDADDKVAQRHRVNLAINGQGRQGCDGVRLLTFRDERSEVPPAHTVHHRTGCGSPLEQGESFLQGAGVKVRGRFVRLHPRQALAHAVEGRLGTGSPTGVPICDVTRLEGGQIAMLRREGLVFGRKGGKRGLRQGLTEGLGHHHGHGAE